MKALVISGGGCKGSFAGGVAQFLVQEQKNSYDILVGTSTGAMLIPLVATEDFVTLKTAYTSVTQKSIFKTNPFKATAPDMELNPWAILYNTVIKGQKTFGDSSNIIATIQKFFTEAVYNEIKSKGKHVVACVANLTKEQVEYYDALNCSYADILDWVRASGTFTPFMSLVEKNGCDFGDGGIFVPLPIQQAIDLGATEIDAIVLDPKVNTVVPQNSKNAFQLIARMTDCMSGRLFTDDEIMASLEAKVDDVKLNIYYTPTVLTRNSLLFNQAEMLRWWDAGFAFAKNNQPQSKITIVKPKINEPQPAHLTRHNLEPKSGGLIIP